MNNTFDNPFRAPSDPLHKNYMAILHGTNYRRLIKKFRELVISGQINSNVIKVLGSQTVVVTYHTVLRITSQREDEKLLNLILCDQPSNVAQV